MSNPGPTQEDYDTLIYKLATLERELEQARKLLEPPAKKPSWWRRYWSGVAVMALAVVLMGAVGWGVEVPTLVTGNNYLTKPVLFQIGYTTGTADAISLIDADAKYGVKMTALFVTKAKGMSGAQILAIVKKYMKDNPQYQNLPMAEITMEAVCLTK